MQEEEWLACTDPNPMLRFLLGTDYPRVQDIKAFPNCKGSDRKLRLFACACYYRVCHLLPGSLAREAVQMAERFADGMTAGIDFQEAIARVWEAMEGLEERWRAARGEESIALRPGHEALALAVQVARPEAPKAAYYASSNAYLAAAAIANPGGVPYDRAFANSQAAEEKAQCDLLRCIFGHLFRPATIPPAVLAWNDATVVKLARSLYAERAFDRLPILADALEEAGCSDSDILGHCRQEGEHVRGCWLVDLILGKK